MFGAKEEREREKKKTPSLCIACNSFSSSITFERLVSAGGKWGFKPR